MAGPQEYLEVPWGLSCKYLYMCFCKILKLYDFLCLCDGSIAFAPFLLSNLIVSGKTIYLQGRQKPSAQFEGAYWHDCWVRGFKMLSIENVMHKVVEMFWWQISNLFLFWSSRGCDSNSHRQHPQKGWQKREEAVIWLWRAMFLVSMVFLLSGHQFCSFACWILSLYEIVGMVVVD